MIIALLALTKFQCDRVTSWMIRGVRRMLRYLLWMIMPVTAILAAVDDRGNDIQIELAEKIADNQLIGMDDIPIDLLGDSLEIKVVTMDGRCLRIKDGVYDGTSKINEGWDAVEYFRKKDLPIPPLKRPQAIDATVKGSRVTVGVKDD